jgi:nicotinamide-nucleotide amidase
MRCAILAVGDELLGSDRTDTNSLRLTAVLARFGVPVATKSVVGDDPILISEAVARLSRSFDLVLVTGGLGPTQDDLTREAVADALGRSLVCDAAVLEDLRRKFARFGIEMAAVNEKQADVVSGAKVLANSRGTAPGQQIESNDCTLFLLPGVPFEVDGLIESALEPWLTVNSSGTGLERRVVKVACLPESTLEQLLQPFYEEWGEDGVSLLPSAGEVMIRLNAAGTTSERAVWLEPRLERLRTLLSERIFSDQETVALEAAAGDALAAGNLSVATAESCTGGLIAQRLTNVAGSSRYFLGSVVSYANQVKRDVLGVPDELLETYGAVSREVAEAMAIGARLAIGSDLAIAVTGIAGPEGGTDEKPVGTVHVALCGPSECDLLHRQLHLPGDRDRIRWITSQWALDMLRRRASGIEGTGRQSGKGTDESIPGD